MKCNLTRAREPADPVVTEALRQVYEGSAPEPFRLSTGDPRFDPAQPLTVNGFLYHPAKRPLPATD